jgi:hypothetical protein
LADISGLSSVLLRQLRIFATCKTARGRFTGFELAVVLCLFANVIGAFQEGETGMRCKAKASMPQLPPQL